MSGCAGAQMMASGALNRPGAESGLKRHRANGKGQENEQATHPPP
jgi:hypothetical protein